jgi:hypothetical protein
VVSFLASFPPIQSAIKVGQDGMRIQFDIPESEMAHAVELLGMRDCVLKVTVERESVLQSVTNGKTKTNKRTKGNPTGVAGG